MPELPEVEVTKRALLRCVLGEEITHVHIWTEKLRFKIPTHLNKTLAQKRILNIDRRAKYLRLYFDTGILILHLGMSGSLAIVKKNHPREKHEHFELVFKSTNCLRLKDVRRFGAVLWCNLHTPHPSLLNLGVEPLSENFNTQYLYNITRLKKRAIKLLITDSHLIAGIGNIYALESLFMAKISPLISSYKLCKKDCAKLILAIKTVLKNAIKQGGTTLRDFHNIDKKAGDFAKSLKVYARANKRCMLCYDIIKRVKQANRSSYYCPSCQKE